MLEVTRPIPRIDPRMVERVVAVRRAQGRRRLRLLLAVTTLAAVTALTVGVLESPLGRVRHVRVSGNGDLALPVVLAAAGLRSSTRMIGLHPGVIAHRLEALPTVGSATVVREWPATVRITLTTRRAVAVLRSGGTTEVLDPTGRVLGTAIPVAGLPAVTLPGPPPAAVAPGSWVIPAGPVAGDLTGELALAAALGRMAPDVSSIGAGTAGITARAGATTVVFGTGGRLADQVAALGALQAAGVLGGGGTLDLTVPNRPVLTPAAPTLTGGASASSLSTEARG